MYLSRMKGLRKHLRENMTGAEVYLWTRIRKKQLGYRFRRQVSLGYYVVDFYCPELSLVIEVDGSVHSNLMVIKKDQFRQSRLEMDNVVFLRLTNNEVLQEIDQTLARIKNFCSQLQKNIRSPALLPLSGEVPEGRGGFYENFN